MSASLYLLGVTLSMHGQHVQEQDKNDMLVRGTNVAMHLCLFVAHVLLTYIGGLEQIYIQWFTESDPVYPVWRILIFDWIVAGIHFLAFLVFVVLYGMRKPIGTIGVEKKRKEEKKNNAIVTTMMKWVATGLTLLVMMLILIFSDIHPSIDEKALARATRFC